MKKLTAFLCLTLACLIPGVASAANHLNNEGVLIDSTGAMVLALYGFTTGTPHTNSHGFLVDDTGALVVTGISSSSGDALVANSLAQFAATTSAQLAGVLSNETGSGLVMFGTSPALLGTPDASGATQFKLPVASSFAALADGEMGWDSAKHWPHAWGMAGNVGGAIDKALLLQSTTELDANTFAVGSSTCGIQEAITALTNAAAVGGTVHVHGRCGTSVTITIKASSGLPDRVTLAGDGANSTSIVYSGSGDAIAVGGTTFDTRYVTIRDLNISVADAAANGIRATRTKHFSVINVSGDAGGAANDFILSDGSATASQFSSFGYYVQNQCNNGWAKCFDLEGSGSSEASNNNNTFIGNEVLSASAGVGYGYYIHTGGSNTIIGGDCEQFAVCVYVATRFNIINGNMESNTVDVQFDYSVWSAAEYNNVFGACAGACIVTDNGRGNVVLNPANGQLAQSGPANYWVADDFDAGNCGNFTAGRNGWKTSNVASIAGIANHPGICEITTTSSSGTVGRLEMGDDTTGIIPQGQRWIATFVAKNSSAAVTNTTIRLGFADASLSNPPTNGIYFENITAGSTTTWNAVARKAGTQTLTACSPTVNLDNTTWHKFEISDDGSDNLRFRIDGVSCATNANSNIPIVSLEEFFQIVNTAAQIDLLDVDFASVWMKTTR